MHLWGESKIDILGVLEPSLNGSCSNWSQSSHRDWQGAVGESRVVPGREWRQQRGNDSDGNRLRTLCLSFTGVDRDTGKHCLTQQTGNKNRFYWSFLLSISCAWVIEVMLSKHSDCQEVPGHRRSFPAARPAESNTYLLIYSVTSRGPGSISIFQFPGVISPSPILSPALAFICHRFSVNILSGKAIKSNKVTLWRGAGKAVIIRELISFLLRDLDTLMAEGLSTTSWIPPLPGAPSSSG